MVKLHPCPICKTLTDNEKYRPFCSKRCADVDLGRWFNGEYSIPAETIGETEYEESEETREENKD